MKKQKKSLSTFQVCLILTGLSCLGGTIFHDDSLIGIGLFFLAIGIFTAIWDKVHSSEKD